MRIGNYRDRLTLIVGDGHGVDVEEASDGRFSADPQAIYGTWASFSDWARDVHKYEGIPLPDDAALGAVAPRPRQVFAIGLNYRPHAEEAGLSIPESPPTFTKFPSCITGPVAPLRLPAEGDVDWEVELVAVIGTQAVRVDASDGWKHVAGLTVGQDYSERRLQTAGPAPQFSLGKSFPGFGPIGPVLVTPDELDDPDDLEVECLINGETVQKDRTSSLIFSVPELVARLSAVCTLYPGDLIFTGTPSGVGHARKPQRYLKNGDAVTSRIDGIGTMTQTCIA